MSTTKVIGCYDTGTLAVGGQIHSTNGTYSTANAGSSLAVNTNNTLIGQDTTYDIYERYFRIPLISNVPAGSTIISASIIINHVSNSTVNNWRMESQERNFGTLSAGSNDWRSGSELIAVSRMTYFDFTSGTSTGDKTMLNYGGGTLLVNNLQASLDGGTDFDVILFSEETRLSSAPTGTERSLFSTNQGSARPRISITYDPPESQQSIMLGAFA